MHDEKCQCQDCKEIEYFRKMDKLNSLIPEMSKDEFNLFIIKEVADSPTSAELLLASKQHRWLDMQRVINEFFKSISNEIDKTEIDVMKLWGLPDNDELVRYLNGYEPTSEPIFKYTTKQFNAYKRIVAQLQFQFIGSDKLLKKQSNVLDDLPIYQYSQLQGFSVGQKHSIDQVRKALEKDLPPDISKEEVEAILMNIAIPQLSNQYLIDIIKNGTKRIKTELALNYIKEVHRALIEMSRDGKSIYQVATYLHKKFGGRKWYWLRICRTEPVLAYVGAFNQVAKLSKIRYVKWSATGAACDFCASLNGRYWRFGHNPEPGQNSHPHCQCILVPYYLAPQAIMDNWTRPSPYDVSGQLLPFEP